MTEIKVGSVWEDRHHWNIRCEVIEIRGRRVYFSYELARADPEATFSTGHAFYDIDDFIKNYKQIYIIEGFEV